MPSASLVIPAFNEGRVLGRCLDALTGVPGLRVIVAANGCTDDTVEHATSRGVDVVEVAEASKVAALNAGDRLAGQIFPRIYLDADIELSADAVQALVQALAASSAGVVAMPRLIFDVSRSSPVVKAFFVIYTQLPYLTEGLVGAGCYAVNEAGRHRWDEFPHLVADDLFVQGKFAREERLTVDAPCVARAPTSISGLLKVRTRTYHGNRQARAAGLAGAMSDSRTRSVEALRRLVLRRPWLLAHASIYVVVNVIAQRRAARMSDDAAWLTDDSSRW